MRRLLLALALLTLAAPALAQSQALTRATYAKDADVQAKIMFLSVKVALDVMNETSATCCGATPEASTAQHDKRTRIAGLVLREPTNVAYRLALAVLTVTTINLASSDADIETVIRAQWDAYAEAMAR